MRRVLTLTFLIGALTACSKGAPAQASEANPAAAALQGGAPAAAGAQSTPAPAKPVPATLPDVVARVNGEAITKAEFELAIKNAEGRAGQTVPPDQRDSVYRGVLDQMIGLRLLMQESQTRKVPVPDADLEARVAEVRQQFPTEEAFVEALKQRNMSVEQLRSDVRKDIAINKLLQQEVEPKVAVKPEDVSTFYQQNPAQFQQPEQVRASHILINAPQSADEATKAKARAKAEGLLKEIKSGKDFAEVAKQNSEDPGSAVNGGDLGYVSQGQTVGPFNDVAFKLAPGAMSDVVETQFGFHIIKVVEKKAAGTVPLDDALRGRVQEYLLQQNRQREATAFVAGLKAKSKVEIFI